MKNLFIIEETLSWLFGGDIQFTVHGIIVLLLLAKIGEEFGKRIIKKMADIIYNVAIAFLKQVLKFIQSDAFRKAVTIILAILMLVSALFPFFHKNPKTTYTDVEIKSDDIINEYTEAVNKLIEICYTSKEKCDLIKEQFNQEGFTFSFSNS